MGKSGKSRNLRWFVLLLCFGAVFARHWADRRIRAEEGEAPTNSVAAEGYQLIDIMLIPVKIARDGVKLTGDFVGGFGWEKAGELQGERVEAPEAQEIAVQESSVVEEAEEGVYSFRESLDRPSHSNMGFRMKPVLRGSEIVGMRVAIDSGSTHPLAQLGLKDGDVVLQINGLRIDGAEALSNIYRVLRTSSRVTFLVERDGHQLTFATDLP